MQAGVVEEVVVVALGAGAVGLDLDHARRHRLEGQLVVDDGRDTQGAAGCGEVADVGLERRVATLVLDDEFVVDPHRGAMGRGVEAQHETPAIPTGRRVHGPLIPDVADVVVELLVDEQVVVARRHRDGAGVGQRAAPPLVAPPGTGGVGRERPHAVEPFALPNPVVLWSQHLIPSNCMQTIAFPSMTHRGARIHRLVQDVGFAQAVGPRE